MKQYETCIQNNNNNNNNKIIIIKGKKKKKKKGGRGRASTGSVRERKFLFYFFAFCFFLRSMKIGSQVFVGTEDKVDLRDENYAWTPKSWSFVKTPRGREFSYLCFF